MIESYLVLDRPTRHEIDKISGSRFIADAVPVSNERARSDTGPQSASSISV